MPHFVIECSQPVLTLTPAEAIIRSVYDTAVSSGLFAVADIKVRIMPYSLYSVAGTDNDFVHVFAYIMQGRNTEQKADLSKKMVSKLNSLFPDVPVISMNVMDFEKATYCNKQMI